MYVRSSRKNRLHLASLEVSEGIKSFETQYATQFSRTKYHPSRNVEYSKVIRLENLKTYYSQSESYVIIPRKLEMLLL